MAKTGSVFVCQQCGHEETKWFGRCSECGSWNSAVESIVSTANSKLKSQKLNVNVTKQVLLAEVKNVQTRRVSTGISELDRVLGGGIVPGQVILIAGEPGIGKSTILLQVADSLGNVQHLLDTSRRVPGTSNKSKAKTEVKDALVMYVSGEESQGQIKIRSERLGVKGENIIIYEETDIDTIIDSINNGNFNNPSVVIIDSIQTMQTGDLSGMAGSVGQVRECARRLVNFAKSTGTPIFIVGHVTKEGTIAGPSVLMHIVDTVLWFEGDRTLSMRLLRAVKNRFGPTDEVGIFTMQNNGLISEKHPEKLFMSKESKLISGSVISVVINGTRPLLVEIQSLINPTKLAIPRRIAQGFDSKKLELLLAVLSRRCGLSIYESDVYVTVMGGISIRNDPSIDLAVCISLASAYFNKAVDKKLVIFGEVGLLGEIREVVLQDKRFKEAKRLGFSKFVTSKNYDYLQKVIKEIFRS